MAMKAMVLGTPCIGPIPDDQLRLNQSVGSHHALLVGSRLKTSSLNFAMG